MPDPDLPEDIHAGDTRHIAHHDELHRLLNHADNPFNVATVGRGVLAGRPAAGSGELIGTRFYFATDTGQLYYDTEGTWIEIGSGLRWVGPYVAGTLYSRGDVTEFNGSSFVAIQGGTLGSPPSDPTP